MFHVEHRPSSKCSTWNIGVFESHALSVRNCPSFLALSERRSAVLGGPLAENVPRGTSAKLKMFHVEHRVFGAVCLRP